ncbi:MAG: hypothetical protein H6696_16240 [Deferribacteres bacterium]|nr:hypothetical protein [candidate division KSB1 bacterium]MCB9503482.1 hypothetical protein [Deferribacteres bacterium]
MNFNELSQIIDAYHNFTRTNPHSSSSDNTPDHSSKIKHNSSRKNETRRGKQGASKRVG